MLIFAGLLLSSSYVFSQPTSITIDGTTYTGSNYTIPSYTELNRCNTSDKSNLSTAITNLKNNNYPYNVVMTIYDDPTTMMAFNWFTNSGVATSGAKVQVVQGNVTDPGIFATLVISSLEFNATKIGRASCRERV